MEVVIKPGDSPAPEENTDGVIVDAHGTAHVTDVPQGQSGEQVRKYAGKFDSVEELERAYQEAQKFISSRSGKQDTPMDGRIPEGVTQGSASGGAVTLDDALAEFAERGEVSDETFAKLEAAGISRKHAERVIAAEQAAANQIVESLAEQVGGREVLRDMLKWAETGLTPEEIQAYNEAINSGSLGAAKVMLRGIKAQYDAAQGTDPDLVVGETTPGEGVTPFTHPDQIVQAMADPRYEVDPEYTRKVDARLAASTII